MMRGKFLVLTMAICFASFNASAIGFCSNTLSNKSWNKKLSEEELSAFKELLPEKVFIQLEGKLGKVLHFLEKHQISSQYLKYASVFSAKESRTGQSIQVLKIAERFFYFAASNVRGLEKSEGEFFGELKTGSFQFARPVQLSFEVEGRGFLDVSPEGARELLHPTKMSLVEFVDAISIYSVGSFQKNFLETHKADIKELFESSKTGVDATILRHLKKAIFTKSGKEVYFVDGPKTKWVLDSTGETSVSGKSYARLDDVDFPANGDLIIVGDAIVYSMKTAVGYSSGKKLTDSNVEVENYVAAIKLSLEKAFARQVSGEELSMIVQPFVRSYSTGHIELAPSYMLDYADLKPLYEKLSERFSEKELETLFSNGYVGFIPPQLFL